MLLEIGGVLICLIAVIGVWQILRPIREQEPAARTAAPWQFYGVLGGGVAFLVSCCIGIWRDTLQEGWHWYYVLLSLFPVGMAFFFFRLAYRLRRGRKSPASAQD